MGNTKESGRTRSFVAGAFEFAVNAPEPEDRELLEALFADLPPGSAEPTGTAFSMTRLESASGPRWRLAGPRAGDDRGLSLVGALTRLMSAVNLCALDADPEWLHLHAAAATKGDRAVIVAAQRNTGKTTTIAQLVRRGWGFVTDETVRLHPEHDEIRGFAKPLSIKPGGAGLVDHLEDWMLPRGESDPQSFRFVPVGSSGATVSAGGEPHLVILLRRPPDQVVGGAPSSRQLHPADAVVALMQETLDADRFGPASLRLAKLLASTRCHEVVLGTPLETALLIEDLWSNHAPESLDVVLLPVGTSTAEGVMSILIGDRVVVNNRLTGQLLALDEAATRVWEQIVDWRDHGIDLAGPVVGSFMQQLRALGVLRDEPSVESTRGIAE